MAVRNDIVAGLAGVRVLVVEDDPLIALDLEDALEVAGAEVLGPVPTVRAALQAVETGRPDLAVLDLNLRGESSAPVARALRSASVPFVIATGYSQHTLDDPVLSAAPLVPKPVNSMALTRRLRELLASG